MAGLLNSTIGTTPAPPISANNTSPAQVNAVGNTTVPVSQTNPATIGNVASYDAAQANPGAIAGTATYNASQSTPSAYTLNPTTDTTGGQLSQIIDQNGPLMQQAQTTALQGANARGLLNSSLAVGAAQGAVLSAAEPIAQSNANASLQTGLANTQQANTAILSNTQAQNTAQSQNVQSENTIAAQNAANVQAANLSNAQAQNSAASQNVQSANSAAATNAQNTQSAAQFNAQAQNTIAGMQLTQANQVALQGLVSGNAQLIQSNTSLSNMYNQTVNNISNIQNSTTMDAATKQTAITNEINLLNEGLAASNAISTTAPSAISSLNLGQYFGATVASANSSMAPTPAPSFTDPNGQVWPSQAAYNNAQAAANANASANQSG